MEQHHNQPSYLEIYIYLYIYHRPFSGPQIFSNIEFIILPNYPKLFISIDR